MSVRVWGFFRRRHRHHCIVDIVVVGFFPRPESFVFGIRFNRMSVGVCVCKRPRESVPFSQLSQQIRFVELRHIQSNGRMERRKKSSAEWQKREGEKTGMEKLYTMHDGGKNYHVEERIASWKNNNPMRELILRMRQHLTRCWRRKTIYFSTLYYFVLIQFVARIIGFGRRI